MGYYIQTPSSFDKATQICALYDGKQIDKPKSFEQIPEDKALIVVVQNGFFDAAGYAYDEREFKAFTEPDDSRPKSFVLIDKEKAKKLSGFER